MLTFDDAKQRVKTAWPNYVIAPEGYDVGSGWIVLLLPETAGGRIPLVSKDSGEIKWISSYSPEYRQDRPVS